MNQSAVEANPRSRGKTGASKSPAVLFSNSDRPKKLCEIFFSFPVSHDLDERTRYECLETIGFDSVEK